MNYCQLPELKKQRGVFHAFSTKEAGSFGIVGGDKDHQTRKKWLEQFGIKPGSVEFVPVVFGANVSIIDNYDKKVTEKADAIITNVKNKYLALAFADCLPVIIFDPKNSILALIHAGWQGSNKKITKKTLKIMIEKFQSDPRDIIIGIGPAIHKNSYIKENTFRKEVDSDLNKFIYDINTSKVTIDLIGANIAQLIESGVAKNNIEISEMDTYKDNFFSHHRSKETHEIDGLNLVIVGMK